MSVREYLPEDINDIIRIWNEVVEEGVAFPQEECLDMESGTAFFASQSYTGVAEIEGKVMGLYILHPNNVGRCGHICNASYAVRSDARGRHIGEQLVKDCLKKGKELGFRILQFNAVVESNVHARHENGIADATVDESSESLKTQNASILVVDDTSVNLQLVKLFLKDSMIVTDTAQDGATALVMAAEKKYDIIFIDRRMPVMDGYEVFRRIKGDTAGVNADSVFILLTADEGNDIREEAIAEGFTDYLSKPFDASTLEKMVRKYLQEEKIVTHNT